MRYQEHLTVKVATLYYLKNLSQEEIAAKLGLSRQSVGRHLKYAREKGVVEFRINSPQSSYSELESELEAKYGLEEVIVVVAPVESEEVVKNEIGKATAALLERRVQSHMIVGVSWSSTVLASVRYLKRTRFKGVQVVQINGSMDKATYSTRAEYIIEQIADSFGGTSYSLPVPLLVDSPLIRQTLLADSRIQATFELANKADLYLFGIGSISKQSSLYKTGYVDDQLLSMLQEKGAVGDICGHFYNKYGEICVPEIDACLMAIERERIMNCKTAIAVAGGEEKIQAIHAALIGKWCNGLVTDAGTARRLVEFENRD